MRQDIFTDLGKRSFELRLVVCLKIKSASFFRGFFEQCLAGVEPDRVGHQIVFGFTAVKLVNVGPEIDVIERSRHADERVIAGRAVVTQRPGRIAPAPAIGQQNQKVFLTPMTNRRRCR